MKVGFTRDGWTDYTSWANERTILKRINRMIEEAARDPATGIGKPERLSHICPDIGLGASPTSTASSSSCATTN